jgi:y4mF family transcriptional regulator
MNPGRFIKEKRKQAGLTQQEFALKACLDLRFIREVEQGKKSYRLDKLNRALIMFGYEMGPVPIDRSKFID